MNLFSQTQFKHIYILTYMYVCVHVCVCHDNIVSTDLITKVLF